MRKDKTYIRYTFTSRWNNDMMIAMLSSLNFDNFEENGTEVISYIETSCMTTEFQEKIESFSKKYEITIKTEEFKDRNWNEIWEASFEPVLYKNFCIIIADFHKIDTKVFKYVIKINPEMTFGTGHHETTMMMIELMSEMNFSKTNIIDFGAGTGILAILAEKMGAEYILAIDNDSNAVENIIENAKKNECKAIKSKYDSSLRYEKHSADIIFANIEKNVLSKEVEKISDSLKKGGIVLLSGILIQDKEFIVDLYENYSLKLMKSLQSGNWVALKFIAY
jgi:ribosomal protein L11 methyltransferase